MSLSIWPFLQRLGQRLLAWSAISAGIGALLMATGDLFWHSFGVQALAWGLVDGAIALVVLANARHSAHSPDAQRQENRIAQKTSRLLWINTGLDVLYILAGVWLVIARGGQSEIFRGYGWGIIIQGGFLFFFDALHALRVPPGISLKEFQLFKHPEFQPFFWETGKPAALFVHGFPGTPDEVRPLAEALSAEGWTVQGLLLPGFGVELATLGECRMEDWQTAISTAFQALRQNHYPVLLVGYSMGAALSIQTLQDHNPDGLVLLAPFLWLPPTWLEIVGFLVWPFLPRYFRPFKRIDFSSPRVRDQILRFNPKTDLDDPAAQEELRQLIVPLSVFGELRRTALQAKKRLGMLRHPTLVILGRQDETVRFAPTIGEFQKIPLQPQYIFVDAGHDLVRPENLAWPQVRKSVVEFAHSMIENTNQ